MNVTITTGTIAAILNKHGIYPLFMVLQRFVPKKVKNALKLHRFNPKYLSAKAVRWHRIKFNKADPNDIGLFEYREAVDKWIWDRTLGTSYWALKVSINGSLILFMIYCFIAPSILLKIFGFGIATWIVQSIKPRWW